MRTSKPHMILKHFTMLNQLEQIMFNLKSLQVVVEIGWVNRNKNKVAHQLAQQAKDFNREMIYPPPDFFVASLQADFSANLVLIQVFNFYQKNQGGA